MSPFLAVWAYWDLTVSANCLITPWGTEPPTLDLAPSSKARAQEAELLAKNRCFTFLSAPCPGTWMRVAASILFLIKLALQCNKSFGD